jgi:hypothetical protein
MGMSEKIHDLRFTISPSIGVAVLQPGRSFKSSIINHQS